MKRYSSKQRYNPAKVATAIAYIIDDIGKTEDVVDLLVEVKALPVVLHSKYPFK